MVSGKEEHMNLVKNLNGTSDNDPRSHGYASWKDFWEDKTSRRFADITCSRSGCTHTPKVGAHVQKVHGGDEWYIVPLCAGCNQLPSYHEFEVRDNDLVPVNDR